MAADARSRVESAGESRVKSRKDSGTVADGPRARSFTRWRRARPFGAGLCMILAGAVILTPAYLTFDFQGLLISISSLSGVSTLLIGVLLIVCGVLTWRGGDARILTGVTSLILGIIALPTSNFGGFILGTALALIGGALALSWSPDERPDGKPRGAKKKARSRGAKKKSRKPGAKAEAGSGVADTGAAPAATGTGAAPVATGTGNGTGNDTGAGPGIARRIPRPDDAGDELSADVAVPARSTGSTGSTGTGGAAGAASLVAVIALVGLLAGPALTPMSASTPRAQAAPAAPAVPQIPGLPGVEGLPLLPGPGLPEVEGLPSPSELLPAPPSPEDEGAGSSGGIGLGAPPEPQAGELAISDSMEVITADSVRLLGNVRLSQTEVTLTNGEVEQAIRFDADRVELDNLALQAANVEVGLTTAPGSMSTLTGNFHIVVRALTVTPAASVGELIPITIDARWIDDEALKALASNSLGLPDAITDELILNDASLDSYIVRSDQLELPPTARIS